MHSSLPRRPYVWAFLLLAVCGLALAWSASALPLHAAHSRATVHAAGHLTGVASGHKNSVVLASAVAHGPSGAKRRLAPMRHALASPKGGRKPADTGSAPPTAVPLYTFPGQPGGDRTSSRLIQSGDGNFYGVTRIGGPANRGTAFRMTPDGTVTVLDSFGVGTSDGTFPAGELVEGVNADGTPSGAFFGTTQTGGDSSSGNGTIYMLAPDAGRATKYAITYLYSFAGGTDGDTPQGGLIVGHNADGTPDGYVYGTTTRGGNGSGVVFRMTTNGFQESVVYAFPAKDSNSINQGGAYPQGALVQRYDASGQGALFGTTRSGGSGGQGTVFSLTPAGQLVTLHDFQNDGSDGYYAVAGLTLIGNGALLGVTQNGGANGYGTVFLLVPDTGSSTGFTYSQIVALDQDTGGPADSLLQASDGSVYGTASFGGAQYDGSVFQVEPDSASATGFKATAIFTFLDSQTQGSSLPAGVTQGTDGDLYGATSAGGSAGAGTLFRLNIGTGAGTPAPQITPPIGYQANADGTATVTINGANFQSGVVVFVGSVQSGTTLSASYVSSSQLVVTLSKTLPDGDHTVTVTNPDNQAASATLTTGGPRITSMDYRITFQSGSRATSTITVNGSGFVDKPGANVTNVRTGTGLSVTFVSASQVVLNLDNTLPTGNHDVTITNPDGTSAKATLTTYDGPQIAPPVGFQYSGNANAALVVDGTSFVRGGTLTVSNTQGTSMAVSLNNSPDPVGTEYTALFTGQMPAGDHLITITNPDGLFTTTTFTTYGRPEINSVNYHLNPNTNTSTVTVNGNHFVRGGSFTIGNTFTGTKIDATINNAPNPEGYQTVAQLNKPLPTGDHLVTIINPDGQTATYTFTTYSEKGPNITRLQSVARADGTSDLFITGTGFVHTPSVTVSNTYDGTSASVTADSTTSISVHLSRVLPMGAHAVKVTNPDGQFASNILTTYGKPRIDGAAAITQSGGEVRMIVSGVDFYPGGYNGDISGATVIVRDSNGAVVPSRILAGPGIPANIGDPQQITLSLGQARSGQNYSVEVDNSDGQTSHPGALSRRASARPEAASAASAQFNVYTKDRTQYHVSLFESILTFFHLQFLLQPSGNASPTQLLPGDVSLIDQHPSLLAPTGPGSIAVGLISNDGGSVISNDGGSVISNDGGSVISNDGGSIVANNTSRLVAQGAGNFISHNGSALLSQDGGGVVSTDGSSFTVPVSGLIAPVGAAAGLGGKLDVQTLISNDGGGLTGHARPQASGSQTAVSFSLTRFDQGAENGTGSTDAVVVGQDESGKDVEVLRIRYTPGQPDVVTYKAPGLALTATSGTPAPQVSHPAPTLTAITPGSVTAGGGAFTLAVTGTLFEDGTVVTWNGQPLATTVLSGTQATALVPAGLTITPGTVQVTVTNPAPGGGSSSPLPLTVKALPALHTFPAGLQLFSVPADYSAVPLGTALSQTNPRLAVWVPSLVQYALSPSAPADALRPGQGYWARFGGETSLYDLGTPTPTGKPFAIALGKGWNMIGDPFPAPVGLGGVSVTAGGKSYPNLSAASAAGLVAYTLYSYPAGSAQYQTEDGGGTLTPYQGYWLYAFQPCTLQVSAP